MQLECFPRQCIQIIVLVEGVDRRSCTLSYSFSFRIRLSTQSDPRGLQWRLMVLKKKDKCCSASSTNVWPDLQIVAQTVSVLNSNFMWSSRLAYLWVPSLLYRSSLSLAEVCDIENFILVGSEVELRKGAGPYGERAVEFLGGPSKGHFRQRDQRHSAGMSIHWRAEASDEWGGRQSGQKGGCTRQRETPWKTNHHCGCHGQKWGELFPEFLIYVLKLKCRWKRCAVIVFLSNLSCWLEWNVESVWSGLYLIWWRQRGVVCTTGYQQCQGQIEDFRGDVPYISLNYLFLDFATWWDADVSSDTFDW